MSISALCWLAQRAVRGWSEESLGGIVIPQEERPATNKTYIHYYGNYIFYTTLPPLWNTLCRFSLSVAQKHIAGVSVRQHWSCMYWFKWIAMMSETQHLNKEFHIETQTWRGIYRSHLSAVRQRSTTRGQVYRSAQHNGLITGGNVRSPSCAGVCLSLWRVMSGFRTQRSLQDRVVIGM